MNNTEDDQNSFSLNPEVIFFDDFSAEKLDRSKWNVEITGKTVNNEQQAYIDSPETIYIVQGYPDTSQGTLVIHPRYQPGYLHQQESPFDFVSGRINTRNKMEFTFGCVSARILLTLERVYGLHFGHWALRGIGRTVVRLTLWKT